MWPTIVQLVGEIVKDLVIRDKAPTLEDTKALLEALAIDEVQLALLRQALIELHPEVVLDAFKPPAGVVGILDGADVTILGPDDPMPADSPTLTETSEAPEKDTPAP